MVDQYLKNIFYMVLWVEDDFKRHTKYFKKPSVYLFKTRCKHCIRRRTKQKIANHKL